MALNARKAGGFLFPIPRHRGCWQATFSSLRTNADGISMAGTEVKVGRQDTRKGPTPVNDGHDAGETAAHVALGPAIWCSPTRARQRQNVRLHRG